MPQFQQTLKYDFGFGVVGEIVRDGPLRAHTGYIVSGSAANNMFGRVFTKNSDGTVGAGGTGAIWGILSNPKQHVSLGTSANGPLDPVFALPNNITADFVEMGKVVCALFGTVPAVPGLQLQFAQATGIISLPTVPGTADSGNTMFAGVVEDYPQPSEAGNLILVKITL